MKKITVWVLAVILLAQLVGCTGSAVAKKKDKDSVQICVDVGYANTWLTENTVEESMNYLLTRLREAAASKGVTVPENIEIEYIPAEGIERETVIDRIQVAIMSGGGPDLFISVCDSKSTAHEEEALFPVPEKIMELGLFLTLDPESVFCILDYMMSYQAQRSDWLYENVLYLGDTASIPMYDELMSEDQRVYQELLTVDGSQSGWYMTEEDFAQLCAIREQITYVKFRNVLDQELTALFEAYFDAVYSGKDTSAIVTEGYRRIQRRVRE